MSYRPMITFAASGVHLVINLDTQTPIERPVYAPTINIGDEAAAHVLAQHLKDTVWAIAKEAREKAYHAGYRDGRAKRGKRTYFPGWFGKGVNE